MGSHSMHSMDILKKRKRKQSQITKKNVLQNAVTKKVRLRHQLCQIKKKYPNTEMLEKYQVLYTIRNRIGVLITIRNKLPSGSHITLGVTQGLIEWKFRTITHIFFSLQTYLLKTHEYFFHFISLQILKVMNVNAAQTETDDVQRDNSGTQQDLDGAFRSILRQRSIYNI